MKSVYFVTGIILYKKCKPQQRDVFSYFCFRNNDFMIILINVCMQEISFYSNKC